MSVYFEHWFNRVQVKKKFFIANLVFLVGSHYLLKQSGELKCTRFKSAF